MMRKTLQRMLILLASLSLAAIAAGAPPPGKVARIGYLVLSPLLDTPSPERAAFMEGLRALGYEEGKNVVIEYRSAEADPAALPFLAEELVDLGVDVIVAPAGPPLRAAKDTTDTIPIVMMFSADPVAMGLVESLARPGRNVTGMSMQNVELGAKRLELLKQTLPEISRVAVIWDSSNPAVVPEWKAMQKIARVLGITLESADVAGAPNFAAAFEQIRRSRPDALMTIIDLRTASYRNIISEFALWQGLPTMAGLKSFARAGGLMSYAPNFADLSRRAAAVVDKILNGANPGELPVEQPVTFELVVNLKTAKALGITVPRFTLLRANEVIE